MTLKNFLFFLPIFISLLFISCDGGIEPATEPLGAAGFSGKVTFNGSWPIGVKRTHLVVFKNEIKTADDFFIPNLSFVSDSIPYNSKEYFYKSIESPYSAIFKLVPGSYSYLVVAQSYTPLITFERKDWFVVGVYCEGGDQNRIKKLLLEPGKITEGVDIIVNFRNPPPQPPGAN